MFHTDHSSRGIEDLMAGGAPSKGLVGPSPSCGPDYYTTSTNSMSVPLTRPETTL